MKNWFLLLGMLLASSSAAQAQDSARVSVASTVGIGIALNSPASTPFSWHVVGYYNLHRRLAVGVGTGVSCYEKTLIPLFADLKFLVTRPRRFTPFVECGAGYGFATSCDANGGLLLNPSVGVQWAASPKLKVLLAVGYELQQMERLKQASTPYFTAEFAERLRHNSLSIRIGVLF